jgi:hypothetical protein
MSEAGFQPTDLAAVLARPDADHSPAAYWFWHHLPTAEQIRDQVGQMQDGGYQSFQIQARLAYPIGEYLDSDYLGACKIAVEEAARRGMTVGIYDDYNWQSGQAGGRTVHGADELRERHLFWASAPAVAGGVTRLIIDQIHSSAADLGEAGLAWQYDGSRVEWTEWEVVAAVAYPAAGVAAVAEIRDVAAGASLVAATESGCAVDVEMPEGQPGTLVTVFVSARSSTSRVPNYLMAEAAQRFIEVGYEPFRQAFGEHFGTTVKYVFFDQPHASFHDWPQRHGNLRSSIPYASDLAARFVASTARNFGHGLVALVMDVGPETASIRCDFYQCFAELVFKAFLETLGTWCRTHSIALSGHEVLGHVGSWHPTRAFSSWDLRVNFGLDSFGLDSYRGITGVDAQDCVPQLSAKMGDSVARANGRSGCIVEQYMGRGSGTGASWAGHWGLTLEELRAQAIRLHIAGARQFLFHGFYQTDGWDGDFSLFTNPRFDFPPGINYEPWWAFHRSFADEIGRLSTFMDGAEPACDVAILYPLRTCWAEGPSHSYGDHMEFWSRSLAEAGFGYHFIDERDLLAAGIRNGRLVIGRREYAALVLPSVTTLRSVETVSVMAAFAGSGGLVVSSGDEPSKLQHGDSASARAAWSAAVAQASGSIHHFSGVPEAGQARQILAPLLDQHPHATATGTPAASQLWQWAGTDADGLWRLVIFNDSAAPAEAEITVPGALTQWQEIDIAIGSPNAWRSLSLDASAMSLSLKPMELTTLRLRTTPERMASANVPVLVAPAEAERSEVATQVPLSAGWTLTIPGYADVPVPIEVGRGWEQQGFSSYSGVGRYTCRFDRPSDGTWQLHIPSARTAVEVRLNGELIGRQAWAPYEFDLPGRLLRPAGNTLEIDVYSAAANKYYNGSPFQDHPEPSGLVVPPVLVGRPER